MHSIVTSKNERWPRLIWPTLCDSASFMTTAVTEIS